MMIAMNVPEHTARNMLYCMNEVFDNSISDKFRREILDDKMRIKRAMCRADGTPKDMIVDYRLDDMLGKIK